MRAHVKCRLTGSPEQLSLGLGDLIGRSSQATLCLDDPRISEAHGLISLRGRELMLLALRGRFRVRGEVCTEVALRAGLDIELYEDLWLHCDEVVLPSSLPGVAVPGLPRTLLTRTTSLFLTPRPQLQPGYDPGADVVFWTLGDTWSYRVRRGAPQALKVGEQIQLQEVAIEIVAIPISDASHDKTRQTRRAPLRLEVSPGSVRVQIKTQPHSALLTGIPGKIFAALLMHDAPQTWEDVAATVWSDDQSLTSSLRRRFDVGLLRLREKLQQFELPPDLISLDGSGMISLTLAQDDEVVRAR